MKTIQEIKVHFNKLPVEFKNTLLREFLLEQELQGKVHQDEQETVIEKRKNKPCPYCSSISIYRRGKQRGVQMYKCNDCNKWYSETTGTPLYDIKLKHKWKSYLNCMEQGMSIKRIAKELNISIQTSFDWRHKILSSLSEFTTFELSDEIECDKIELALSQKGGKNRKRVSNFKKNIENTTKVQVIKTVEINEDKFISTANIKQFSKNNIGKAFYGKFENNTIIEKDKHSQYKAFAKGNSIIKYKALDLVDKKNKAIHLQRINSTHGQVKDFLRPFKGISSKYMQNYLNWYAYIIKLRNSKTKIKQCILTMLLTGQAYFI